MTVAAWAIIGWAVLLVGGCLIIATVEVLERYDRRRRRR